MQPKPKKCINVAGDLQFELHQKTLLFILYQNYTSGATGYFVEYAGNF
jgi:3-isopropylmalate/(R)-2-methylmalate dehydratase large subunit